MFRYASFILLPFLGLSQEISQNEVKQNTIGIELGGTGITYSVYYERIRPFRESYLQSIKFGISYPGIQGLNYLLLPVDYNLYLGGVRNKIFIGPGVITLIGLNPNPPGIISQIDYRKLYNSNPYNAIIKYHTEDYNSTLDFGITNKIGYMYSGLKLNWYVYWNCFYIRFTYKYQMTPFWLGTGVSFRF